MASSSTLRLILWIITAVGTLLAGVMYATALTDDAEPRRVGKTFMSTLGGKHGSRPRRTEVPRTKLVEELEKNSTHFTTQSLRKKSESARDFEILVAT